MQDEATDSEVAKAIGAVDLSHFDLDGDGQIDWKEFVAATMAEHEMYNEDNLTKVFRELDTDGSGTLCQSEVAKLLGEDHELSRDIIQQLTAAQGSNSKDLAMTLDEFKKLLTKDGSGSASEKTRKQRRMRTAAQLPVDKV